MPSNSEDAKEDKSSAASVKKKVQPLDRKAKYTEDLKKEAVKLAVEFNNNREAARKMQELHPDVFKNLNESLIREWRKDPKLNSQYEFDRANENRKQVREVISPFYAQEEVLVDRIRKMRENKERVSKDWIIQQAKDLFKLKMMGLQGVLDGLPIFERGGESPGGWLRTLFRSWEMITVLS